MDTSIRKAHEKIMSVAQDSDMLRLYEMQEMALLDYTSGINNATREGEQRGMQKGIAIGEQKGIAIGEQRGIVIGEQKGIVIGEQKGIVIGEQRGLQRGLQQAQVNYVLKLFRKSKSVAEIAELTDLPVEEVNHILNSN
jgi:predicted transposase YdaD